MKSNNHVKNKIIRITSGFLIGLLCFSCSKPSISEKITLPVTPQIATVDRFALIIDPYISLRDEPGELGITIAHARRGDIFSVNGKRLIESGKKIIVWLDLGNGWIPETSVQLYSNYEKAKTASIDFQ